MNAAFLLVTSAWLVGGQAAPPPAPMPPPAAPAAPMPPPPAGSCSSCGGGYGSLCGGTCGCNEERCGFFDRLRARFHREEICGCGCPCVPPPKCAPAPAPVCKPAPAPCGCNECEKHGLFDRFRGHGQECGCSGTCGSTCNECERPSLFERLRGRFHKEECGCAAPACTTCSSCGAAPLPPTKPAEPIKPPTDGPMKLPSGDNKPAPPKETSSPKNLDLTPTGGDGGGIIIESGTKNPY